MGSTAQVVGLVSSDTRDTSSVLMQGGGRNVLTPEYRKLCGREKTEISICSIKHEARSSTESGDEEGLGRRCGSFEGRKQGMR